MPANTTSAAPYKTGKTFWDDLRFQITNLAPGGTPPDTIVFGPSGNIRCFAFDGAATLEAVEGMVQFPHSWKAGTSVYPHVHWAPTTTNLGNVVWQLDYYWLNFGDVAGGAPTTIAASATPAQGSPMGTAWKHMINSFGAVSATNKNISSILAFRLFRDPANGSDTYADDAALIAFDIHYEVDSFGSYQEYIK